MVQGRRNYTKFNSHDFVKKPAERCKEKRRKSGGRLWVLKVTLITFLTTAIFTILSDTTVSSSSILVASLIVIFLVFISIIFDIVGVAVTSCDISSLVPAPARGIKEGKIAISLVKNASKVSSICSDVIGDICSIVCGACGTVIVSKILVLINNDYEFILTILVSSLVAGLTVGGKAFGKKIAINYSRELVMLTARILSIFKIKRKKDKNYEYFEKCNVKRRQKPLN